MKTLPNVVDNLPCRNHDNFQGLVNQKFLRSSWLVDFKVGETDCKHTLTISILSFIDSNWKYDDFSFLDGHSVSDQGCFEHFHAEWRRWTTGSSSRRGLARSAAQERCHRWRYATTTIWDNSQHVKFRERCSNEKCWRNETCHTLHWQRF